MHVGNYTCISVHLDLVEFEVMLIDLYSSACF